MSALLNFKKILFMLTLNLIFYVGGFICLVRKSLGWAPNFQLI